MIATAECSHKNHKKSGKNRNGTQRYKCKDCGTRFADPMQHDGPFGAMRIDPEKAMMVLGLLLEGMSIRACERLTGVPRSTIDRLILVAGERCQKFIDDNIVDVPVSDIQIDETWSFVGKKDKRVTSNDDPGYGDSWTWICLDRESKLVVAHYVGGRGTDDSNIFLRRVRRAVDTTRRFQVSTDGFPAYQYGVPFILGSNIDFGMLVKKFESTQTTTRYSPAAIVSIDKRAVWGNPDPDKICTSHVESLNQKLRMHLRRFTRLTNAHSKSIAHHIAMQAVFFASYNFCRVHSSIGKTPAMAAGIFVRPLNLVELLT